jgi:hypothetical protein
MIQATEDGNTTNGFLERHRSAGIVAFLALLVLLAIPCGWCAWWFNSTSGTPWPYPTPAFSIEELLLDESTFPEGWRAARPFDPERRIPAEQIVLDFHTNKCHVLMAGVSHRVQRFYGGASAAAEAYPEEVAYWFSPNWGDWSVPSELSYKSPMADQFRFGCYTEEETATIVCQTIGQYEQYIVVFDAELDPGRPECLTFDDLEKILIAVDERMAEYLGKDTQ